MNTPSNTTTARSLGERVAAWAAEAKEALTRGELSPAALDHLIALTASPPALRQRLLYLHASTPSIASPLLGAALHEPVTGGIAQLDPQAAPLPYNCVADAIRDGWQVIHFPQQNARFDDREIDVLGYEFILQKLEPFDDRDHPGQAVAAAPRPTY